jgi:hypothetical protein
MCVPSTASPPTRQRRAQEGTVPRPIGTCIPMKSNDLNDFARRRTGRCGDRCRDPRTRRRTLSVLPLLWLAGACTGESSPTAGWTGTIDTLASGVIVTHNPERGVWESGVGWQVVEETRIGTVEGTGPDAFGRLGAALDDALGRVWVLDQQARAIHVFGADGAWIRSVGQEGAGPGEFRRPIDIERAPDGRMWVIDPANARYSVFDTAGNFITSYRREIGSSAVPWPGGIDNQGRLFDYIFTTVPERTRFLVRLDLVDSASAADTVPLPDPPAEEDVVTGAITGGVLTASVPYGSRYAWSLVPDGRILYGMTAEYRIYVNRLDGTPIRIIEKESRRDAVTADQRDEARELMQGVIDQGVRFDDSMLPDRHPSFDTMFADDRGYIWVRPHRPSTPGDATTPGLRLVPWDVFDPDGRYLGRLEGLPRTISVYGNHIVGIATDELGVNYVLRYRIDGRPPTAP